MTAWQPTAHIDTLKQRARILQNVRAFFAERNVLEVQVPTITTASVTEVHIDSIPVELLSGKAFLHTSPEYPMKRLLAAGMGDSYYLGSVFRQGESGGQHNPEFTMLEWYRLDFELEYLIAEVIDLATEVIPNISTIQNFSYVELIYKHTGVDVFNTSCAELKQALKDNAIDYPDGLENDIDLHLDLLISTVIFPKLKSNISNEKVLTVIKNYPKSQAALASLRKDEKGREVAARFEVFVDGVEIANGYQESQDAEILEKRFKHDNSRRISLNKSEMPIDKYLLDAITSGLPDCSGVALGFDRLVMLALGKSSIQEVIAFPIDIC